MRAKILGLVAIVAVTGISDVQAKTIIDMTAPFGAVGCFTKRDLVDLMSAGRITAGNDGSQPQKVLLAKFKAKRCIRLGGNQVILSMTQWQNQDDMMSGIGVYSTRDGLRFYATAWSFRYVGERN